MFCGLAESSRMCWLQILVVVSRGNSVTGVIEFFRKEENILKGKSALYEIHWPGLDGWRTLPWIPERSYQWKVGKFTSSSYSECESEWSHHPSSLQELQEGYQALYLLLLRSWPWGSHTTCRTWDPVSNETLKIKVLAFWDCLMSSQNNVSGYLV